VHPRFFALVTGNALPSTDWTVVRLKLLAFCIGYGSALPSADRTVLHQPLIRILGLEMAFLPFSGNYRINLLMVATEINAD
jgi:hypothetical protein